MFVKSLPTNMASGASRKRQRFLGEADTDRAAGGGRGTWETLYWGLGWGLELTPQGRFCWQWGDNPGFKAFALASLETGDGFVALTNSDNGDRLWRDLAREFSLGRHPALDWLEKINARP
jgi:hypothetical protein